MMNGSLKHGMTRTPEWEAWRAMLKRCYKPTSHNYDRYGGRGITVCDRWRESFANFFADMGYRPSSRRSLHRKDNNGNYEPSNCEWALPKTQANNRGKPVRGKLRVIRPKRTDARPVNFNDLTGECFGRWSVISFFGRTPGRSGGAVWLCRCECGNEKKVRARSLQSGRSKSCGCLHKEIISKIALTATKKANTKHGLSATREYAAWNQMLQRCHNEKNPTFSRYGATGIKVCDRWRNSFEDFLADLGQCPTAGHTLDRINAFGNYEPGNCRWATDEQQRLNQRRTRRFMFEGELLTIMEISRRSGIRYSTLHARLVRFNWTIEQAVTQGIGTYENRKKKEK